MKERLLAATTDLGEFLRDAGESAGVAESGGAEKATVQEIAGGVISAVLGALGIVFLVLSVYAGFLWATSQGNEEKVKKAKQILSSSVIGLIITLAAYAIASFVVENAIDITTSS